MWPNRLALISLIMSSRIDSLNKARICFVIPYTGEWPGWSKLFFDSVGRNPAIDVLVACTTLPPCQTPANARLIQLTNEELSARMSVATGLSMGPIAGHKLCDFKPFFGLAFADLLSEYEFWGFCDVDLVLGDLSKLLTSDFLARMDVYSAHDEQIVGHFTIVRNNERLNQLGFKMADWKAACLSPETEMVDEKHFSAALDNAPDIRWVRPNRLPEELGRTFCRQGITFGFHGEVAYLDNNQPNLVDVRDNKVVFADGTHEVEVLYVHFMGLKHWWHWLGYREGSHPRFSRIGYGGPTHVEALSRFPWKALWVLQVWLVGTKSWFGGMLRRMLPHKAFLSVRRTLLGRSRY